MSTARSAREAIRWINAGIGAGLLTCVAYPLVSMAPLPRTLLVVLAATLGPSLALASLGLREALRLHDESMLCDLGALFNILAGVLFEAMLLVQLAVRLRSPGDAIPEQLVGVCPAVGVWYLAATILTWRSMSWLKETARQRYARHT